MLSQILFWVLTSFLLLHTGLPAIAAPNQDSAPVGKYPNELYVIYENKTKLEARTSVVEDFNEFVTVELSTSEYQALKKQGYAIEPLQRHRLQLGSGHTIDTRGPETVLSPALHKKWGEAGFYIVQFYAPIRSEWLDEVKNLGTTHVLSAYFPSFGRLVWVPNAKALQDLSQLSFVNWIGVYQPVYKTPGGLEGSAKILQGKPTVNVRVKVLNSQAANRVANGLRAAGIGVHGIFNAVHYLESPYLVAQVRSPAQLEKILSFAEVWWVEEIVPAHLTSRVARELHQTGLANGCTGTTAEIPIWNAGIRGAGATPSCTATGGSEQLVGVLDTTFNNPDFECGSGIPNCTIRKFIEYNSASGCTVTATRSSCISGHSHGSGSAGVILGNGSQQGGETPAEACREKGGAFGARLWAFRCDQASGDLNCLNSCHGDGGVTTLRNFFQTSFADGSRLSNHSWGADVAGVYDSNSEVVDIWAYDNDNNSGNGAGQQYLWFFAAGNAGGGANTIGSPATAKNDVTGAAVYNGVDGSCWPGDSAPCNENKLVIYSSRGPTDDGRYGPEVAGASQYVTAPNNGTGYQEFNGTSCGTPSVTALGALIRDWVQNVHGIAAPSANLVKALLLNSGDYISSPSQSLPATGQGWGRPNLSNLCDNWASSTCTTRRSSWQEGTFTATGQSSTMTVSVQSTGSPLRCLLTWMDPPNLAGGGALRNNLNLRVTAPGGTFYNGNDFTGAWSDANGTTFDSANNSEGVRVQVPATGSYSVQVTAANISLSPQPWAVTCSANTGTCTLPGTPSLISPANGATGVSVTPTLDWSDVSGATSYDVQVATDSGFTNVVRSANVASSTWVVSPALNNSTTYFWRARANNSCGAGAYSSAFSFTTVAGGGGGSAVFDPVLQAPKCATVAASCDTGASLVLGRANLGPEPNQPNTINDSCADGTSGTFHSDESNDRLKVTTLDATNLAEGKTVRIEATVWAWTTPSADKLDLYYAANANSPSWTFITTLTPTVAGAQTLTANYTLPTGALQAVRAQFRYQGTASACTSGAYNDRDDLVFAVQSTPVTTVFFDNFETSQGWVTNPSGTDTATTGQWERGDPEPTDSGGPKQLGTTVSGVNDLVTARLAGASAGVNDIDGGVTSIWSPQITLPATGTLTLSFQYYLAHGSNSSTADFFRAFIVTGTNNQVFQSLGAASNRNGVWTPVSVNINSFAGQTIRILFQAADASTASLVEAGVDDVRITQQ